MDGGWCSASTAATGGKVTSSNGTEEDDIDTTVDEGNEKEDPRLPSPNGFWFGDPLFLNKKMLGY